MGAYQMIKRGKPAADDMCLWGTSVVGCPIVGTGFDGVRAGKFKSTNNLCVCESYGGDAT